MEVESDEYYEFEITCEVCGKATWIYGTRADEDAHDEWTCLDCREEGGWKTTP